MAGHTSPNKDFDILEDINEDDDTVPYNLIPYERKGGLHPSMTELLEGLQGKNCNPSFLSSNVVKNFIVVSPIEIEVSLILTILFLR